MSDLIWIDDYRVGIPSIDNEHRLLVSLINDFSSVLDAHKDVQAQIVNDNLSRLESVIRIHFKSEEDLLALNSYPGLDEHREEHIYLLERLHTFISRYREKNVPFTENMLLFIKDWLVRHIILHDCKFGYYYRDKELVTLPSR